MSAQDIGVIIRSALAADPTVAAAVDDRIFPEEAPEEAALPLIVYAVRVANPGEGTAPIWDAVIDVHCYTAEDDQAQALAVGADGVLGGMAGHYSGTWLKPLTLESWQDSRDADNNIWARLLSYSGIVARM